jgi:hypothetical protein
MIHVIFGSENLTLYVKHGINYYLVHGNTEVVNPDKLGTEAPAL